MSEFGKDVVKFLFQPWVITWLAVIIVVIALLVVIVFIRVRKIHFRWKSPKREFTLHTDNGNHASRKQPEVLTEKNGIPSSKTEASKHSTV